MQATPSHNTAMKAKDTIIVRKESGHYLASICRDNVWMWTQDLAQARRFSYELAGKLVAERNASDGQDNYKCSSASWHGQRNTAINQLLELEPTWERTRLEAAASAHGLSILWDLRNHITSVRKITADLGL